MDNQLIKKIIIDNNLLPDGRLRELEALASSSDQDLLSLTISGGYLKEESLLPKVAEELKIEWTVLDEDAELDEKLLAKLPKPLLDSGNFLPLEERDDKLWVAVADPMEVEKIDMLEKSYGIQIGLVLASRNRIEDRLKGVRKIDQDDFSDAALDFDNTSLEDLANQAPIIKLVNLIIMQAISEGASDIHIEPFEDEAVVRFRIDGVLKENSTHSAKGYPAIISRIKIMANLDIAERRIPQDGRIALRLMERSFDLRVATTPVLHGEGVVMRILDKSNKILDLGEMGFSPTNLENFRSQIELPHGIILVTGPTGSGKTTTLNAAVSEINKPETNIITIEDPVEYEIKGVNQIHVNVKVGLTFATGLRSILRLDPDVIMVGEIRDNETAEIALRTALTGHLVFSTLHTNDAASAITRLIDMGIEPYLISSCLNAILAQRLVRRVCQFCSTQEAPSASAKELLAEVGKKGVKKVVAAKGCDECHGSGYSGRIAIHEFLEITEEMRRLINQRVSTDILDEQARKQGMKTLREDGVEKFAQGITTAEEVVRVTQMDQD